MWIWRTLGIVAFVMGAIGVVLPIWPTTIFWILAAICFARSNPVWRDWIYARPHIGSAIEGFVERGVLNRTAKLGALAGMGIALAVICILMWGRLWPVGISAGIIAIAALIVVTRPTP